ncbi:MAG: NAD-dependent epimerase/dehydratase family protein [Parcubacteria group bacterium]|nr:NAD-dependent epimerase/dehydratase family protein [Parcubacteria group bacterium]
MTSNRLNQLKNKTVLITGAAGFIGSHLSGEILRRGARVVCFDDLSTGSRENLKDFLEKKNFVFTKGDANNLADLKKIFKKHKIDYVFHYAACVGVLRTLENPLRVLKDIDGIKNILELSRIHKVKKVIFSSSSEVYGEPVEIPEREDGHLNAKLPYATVKLIGEHYMNSYYEKYGLPTCSLRFFNVYGPRQESSAYGFVTGVFIRQVLNGEPITIFGNGTQTRDFVFIEDNIAASLSALFSDKANGHVINIGTGRPVTILDLAEKIIALSCRKGKIEFLSPRTDILHRFPDVKKMRAILAYTTKISLDDGLQETLRWYENNMNRFLFRDTVNTKINTKKGTS